MALRILTLIIHDQVLHKCPIQELKKRKCFIQLPEEHGTDCNGNIQYENICKVCYVVLKNVNRYQTMLENIIISDKLYDKIPSHNSKCVLCLKECEDLIGSIEICLRHKKELEEIYLTLESTINDI